MCDYSLAHFPNRLAVEGEQLLVYRFSSGTRGFTSQCLNLKEILSSTRPTAVCVPPGARLLLQDIPEDLQQNFGIRAVEEVTFIEQTCEAFTHRDAVRFTNGREILLQYLRCGQRVDVLSLSSETSARVLENGWREEDWPLIQDVLPETPNRYALLDSEMSGLGSVTANRATLSCR